MVRTLGALAALSYLSSAAPARADDWLGRDKALHFSFSVALGGAGYAGSSLFFKPRWARATTGAAFSLALGGAKELWDIRHGDPSAKDFAWDVAGTAVGVGLGYLLDWAVTGDRVGERVR